MQHPDITAIERDGWPSWATKENQDTDEARRAFFEDKSVELLKWLQVNHREVLDEFIEDNDREYFEWLN